jgi:hypothetical protein
MVSVLYAESNSVYKMLPNCDVWDKERDARRWQGNEAIVTHPPCGQWGRLRTFARADIDEKSLAVLAVLAVRKYGGVLEHPKGSLLWKHCRLPEPGQYDRWGGYTMPILQQWFGHRAEKATWLYIVGCPVDELPSLPFVLGASEFVVQTKKKTGYRRHLPKKERLSTPRPLAEWLLEVAKRCGQKLNG